MTSTNTPAERLRQAADKIRKHAEDLNGQRWEADHYPEGTVVRPAGSTLSLFRLHGGDRPPSGTPCVSPAAGAWIALMHPGVGEALAAVLDQAAQRIGHYQTAAARIWNLDDPKGLADAEAWLADRIKRAGPALALADQILGGLAS